MVFSLVSGAGSTGNAAFTISGSSVLAAAALPNGPLTLSIRVQATDSGGLSTEAPLTITITAAPVAEEKDSGGVFGCGLGGGVSLFLGLSLGLLRLRREQRS
jgi:hypothetical protein